MKWRPRAEWSSEAGLGLLFLIIKLVSVAIWAPCSKNLFNLMLGPKLGSIRRHISLLNCHPAQWRNWPFSVSGRGNVGTFNEVNDSASRLLSPSIALSHLAPLLVSNALSWFWAMGHWLQFKNKAQNCFPARAVLNFFFSTRNWLSARQEWFAVLSQMIESVQPCRDYLTCRCTNSFNQARQHCYCYCLQYSPPTKMKIDNGALKTRL